MKRNITLIILLIFGIGLIAYPIVSNILAAKNQTVAISKYKEIVGNMSEEEINTMLQDAELYNQNLASVVETNQEDVRSYADYLNAGDIIAYVSVPKANIYLPIYHGIGEKALTTGIGHMEKTSLPVGGESTHSVLAGHSGLSASKMFDDIRVLEVGDKFYIYVLNKKLAYKVDQIKTVEPHDDRYLQIVYGEDYVTLLTCTPFVLNTHRLLVRGTRISEEDEIITNNDVLTAENGIIVEDTNTNINSNTQIIGEISNALEISWSYLIVSISAFLLFIVVVNFIKRQRNKPKPKHRK